MRTSSIRPSQKLAASSGCPLPIIKLLDAEFIAKKKEIDLEELKKITFENSKKLFGLN